MKMIRSTVIALLIFHLIISLCYVHTYDATSATRSNDRSGNSASTSKSKIVSNARQMLNKLALSYNAPEQIHISFGNETSNIIIIWSSSSNERSSVQYGNNPNKITYAEARCIELKEHSENAVKFIHRAELLNLIPGTHYTYRIVSGLSETKSRVFSLDVPHEHQDKSHDMGHTLMVVADMGLQTRALPFVVQEALSNQYDALFHIGDIAYNLDYQGGSYGDQFMNRIQKFTSMLPYMTIPGDHEKKDNFYHYRHRFSSPGAMWPMREEDLWYSINIGYAHIIGINTQAIEADSRFQSEQLDWLEQDLIKANRRRHLHPWIVVMGHRPLYCSKSVNKLDCDDDNSKLREALEDLLFKYGVDLYVSGHKHCYERSFPVYKSHSSQMSYINAKAPIYVIIGTMGYPYRFHEQKSQPKWLAASVTEKDKQLFGRLTITNRTHLRWTAHIATDNKKVDEMNIIQHQRRSVGIPGDVAIDGSKNRIQSTEDAFKTGQFTTSMDSFNDPMNRHLMLTIGIFSFSFLVFLLVRYSGIRCVS